MKNKTKKILLALSLTATFSSVSLAEEEAVSPISANVTIASEYVWRGLTQTDGEPAIQGGFDYAHESGFAAGIWGSNVDFGGAQSEFDLYASYSGEMNDFGYEVGYIAYRYPGSVGNDFNEAYIGGSYAGANLTYYAGLGDFSDGGAEVDDYVEVSYDLPIEGVDVSVLYGDYDNSHNYYGVGIGKSFGGIDFALNYTDTDPDNGTSGESNTVLSISKSF